MLKTNLRSSLAPSPYDYIQSRIAKMRESLSSEQVSSKHDYPVAQEELSHQDGLIWSSVKDDEEDREDVALSQVEDVLRCSEPAQLLPTYQKGVHSRTHLHGDRPTLSPRLTISMLLFTTLIFVFSSTAYHILSRFNLYEATYKFPFPLSLCLLQFIFCDLVVMLWTLASFIIVQIQPQFRHHFCLLEPMEWQLSEAKRLMPVSLTYLISWTATLSCLEYLPMNSAVLFLAPMMLFQLSFTKWVNPEAMQSIYVAASCGLLMLGYILTSITTSAVSISSFNVPGLLSGLLASVAFPIHHSLIKKTLPTVQNNVFQLFHYILVTASAIIIPLVIISGEIFEIGAHCFFLDEKGFWLMILVLCLISVLNCGSQLILVAYTSPLTVTVLYFLKTALIQIPFSDSLNRSGLQWLNYAGIAISILGALGYIYHSNPHRPWFGLHWFSQ